MARKVLSASQKRDILQQRPYCFICDEAVSDSDLSELDFDHIVSLDAGGSNELTNFAGVHRRCHKGKGIESLEVHKEKRRLDKEFSTLVRFTDVAKKLNPSGDKMQIHVDREAKEVTFGDGSKAQLHECPNTNLLYFYHPIPRKYLGSDEQVQPRGLEQKRLRELALNLRGNFQLSPTVCRLITSEGQIKVFDGQHKATAQALGNQNETVDCKVFIDPLLEMVRRVVMEAHGALRQQGFKTSELYVKLTANFNEQLKEWRDSHPGRLISEAELPQALRKSKKEVEKDIVAYITESVRDDPDCEMVDFVSEEKRPGKLPLNYDMFAWWVNFLIKRPLIGEPMESDQNLREDERQNIVRLFNCVAQDYLQGKWTPENAGNTEYKKARKLFYRASFREWARLISNSSRIIMFLPPEEPVFYRQIPEETWHRIEAICKKLISHSVWVDPNPLVETTLNSNVQGVVAELFRTQGLNPEFLCKP